MIFRLVQACRSYQLTRAYLEVRIWFGILKRLGVRRAIRLIIARGWLARP